MYIRPYNLLSTSKTCRSLIWLAACCPYALHKEDTVSLKLLNWERLLRFPSRLPAHLVAVVTREMGAARGDTRTNVRFDDVPTLPMEACRALFFLSSIPFPPADMPEGEVPSVCLSPVLMLVSQEK